MEMNDFILAQKIEMSINKSLLYPIIDWYNLWSENILPDHHSEKLNILIEAAKSKVPPRASANSNFIDFITDAFKNTLGLNNQPNTSIKNENLTLYEKNFLQTITSWPKDSNFKMRQVLLALS